MEDNNEHELLVRLASAVGKYIRALDHFHAFERQYSGYLRMRIKLDMVELFDASGNESLTVRLRQFVQRVIDETQTVNEKAEAAYQQVISVGLLLEGKTLADVDAYFHEEEALRAEIQLMYDRAFSRECDPGGGDKNR